MHVLIIPSDRFICEDSPIGGIFQAHQARALQLAGLTVGVIAPAPRSLRWLRKGLSRWERNIQFQKINDIPIYRYQGWSWFTSRIPFFSIWFWKKCGMILFDQYIHEQGVPDIIHAHNSWFAGNFASMLKRQYKIPFVLTEHDSIHLSPQKKSSWQKNEMNAAFYAASERIMVSEALGRAVERKFGLAPQPWQHVPNILDELFENTELVSNRLGDTEKFRFLHIANFVRVKNQRNLLLAFSYAFGDNPAIQLRLGGDGPLRTELETLAMDLEIEKQVLFIGYLNRKQVLAEMQLCNAFVLPSEYETFGVVLIEAAACGRPVIAISGSGPDGIIHDGNGVLVSSNDYHALADVMKSMYHNIDRYDPIAIRQDCITRFGSRTIVDQLITIYNRVLS